MFYYSIYGKSIAINIELPLLKRGAPVDDYDIQIFVEYAPVDGDDYIHIREINNKYAVHLGRWAVYHIDVKENTFFCQAKDFESFFSTLFNIPFSIYFLSKNEILFHACSLIYDNQVFCLTGNKGVGKSTLTQILNQYDKFQVFGDDTIRISNGSIGSRAHNLMKQTNETVNSLNTKTLNIQNIAGKFYVSFGNEAESGIVKKIFHISRSEEKSFVARKVTNKLRQNSIYKSNVVGITHMPYKLLSNSLKIHQNNIEFYELFVPNDLHCVIDNSEELKRIIINSFGGEQL